MGNKDQFQDKAREAAQQAKQSMQAKKNKGQDTAQQRSQQMPDEAQRAQQEAQDKLDMDYDI
ncbi:hypothetical protein ACGFRG_27660 [Streptomyces sp. NPDC048696]|uniref:hypothetical protein n=1 Tax=Streptomyces sp. NPDC048696 TaxID=3365585 RepID=UPI0037235719